LALQGATRLLHLGAHAVAAELARDRERERGAPTVGAYHERGPGVRRGRDVRREQDALDTGCPADARGRRPAELLDEAVVATAASQRALRAELGALELEHGPRVVIEPADESPVDLVGLVRRVEESAHLSEVLCVV